MEDSGDHSAIAGSLVRALTVISLGISVVVVMMRWPSEDVRETEQVQPDYQALLHEVSVPAATKVPLIPFSDQTAASGIDFIHTNGATGEKLLPESLGGGGAFFDFDRDGDQDILCVNSTWWPGDSPVPGDPPTSALYANDGTGHFQNVTPGSGLDVPGIYGNGVACGDYDGDGAVDVYITAVGRNRLFRNVGGGRFEDVTILAGVAGKDNWSTSAGWFDYDLDGDLDLFVCNYLTWSAEVDRSMDFTLTGSVRGYGRPADFPGSFPVLYRNDGQGSFTDVSEDTGIRISEPATGEPLSKSLGLTFAYVDSDDRLDVIVANDTVPNQVFLNRVNGTFDEVGVRCGMAFDNDGSTRGAMGIDTSYFRNTDALGVTIGNYANEMTALYVNQLLETNVPLFRDEAVSNGIGPVTRIALTFGMLFCDIDLDGRADLVASNGHLDKDIGLVQSRQQYAQSPQLLWNAGARSSQEFVIADESSVGADFVRPMVGRGATRADVDGDGDVDLLLFALNGTPRLLRNDQQTGHHWLRVRLTGKDGNREAIGARVLLLREDGRVLQQTVMPTCSYQSQVEPVVTFGLAEFTKVKYLKVVWPDGSEQTVDVAEVDRVVEVEQPR